MFRTLKKLFIRKQAKVNRQNGNRVRLRLETLEDRITPSNGFDPIDYDYATADEVPEDAADDTYVGITALSTNPPSTPVTYELTNDAGGRFQIDASSGAVSVKDGTLLDFETSTSYNIAIVAHAGIDTSNPVTFTIYITDVAPGDPTDDDSVENVITSSAVNGAEVGITAVSTDVHGGDVHFSLSDDAEGIFAIDPDSGVVTVADASLIDYSYSDGGYTITVVATDDTLATEGTSFTIFILHDVSPMYNGEGDSVSTSVTNGASGLTYSASGLPSGLSINSSTGVISGTVASSTADEDPYQVTVTVTNGPAGASTTFSWFILEDPVSLDEIDDQNSVVGDSISFQVSAGFVDLNSLTFSATGLPSGLAIDVDTGIISGTIDTGAESGSPYSVTVTATVGSHTSNQPFLWYVTLLGLADPGDQENVSGDVAYLPLSVSNATGSPPTFGASGLPGSLSIDTGTGEITGTLGSGDVSSSPYSVTVTATVGSDVSMTTFSWVVKAILLDEIDDQVNYTGDSGVSLMPVLHYNGINTPVFSASGLPDGLTIDTGTGEITGTIDDDADDSSPFSVTLTVTAGSDTASRTFDWTILSAVLVGTMYNQENFEGQTVSIAVNAADVFDNTITYSATGLPTGLTIDPDTGVISGTLAPGTESLTPYSVSVTATAGGRSDTTTFDWTVGTNGGGDANNRDSFIPAFFRSVLAQQQWERRVGSTIWTFSYTPGGPLTLTQAQYNPRTPGTPTVLRTFTLSVEDSLQFLKNLLLNGRNSDHWLDGMRIRGELRW